MEKGEIKNILVKLSCDYMRFTHTCFSIVFKDSESIQKFTASELYVFYRIMDAFEYIPYLIEHIDMFL